MVLLQNNIAVCNLPVDFGRRCGQKERVRKVKSSTRQTSMLTRAVHSLGMSFLLNKTMKHDLPSYVMHDLLHHDASVRSSCCGPCTA